MLLVVLNRDDFITSGDIFNLPKIFGIVMMGGGVMGVGGYCAICCRVLGGFLHSSNDPIVSLANTEKNCPYMSYPNEEVST